MQDLGDNIPKVSFKGIPMYFTEVAFPCGLIGKYMFDDTYKLYYSMTATQIPINETNIAHPVDKKRKFKYPPNYERHLWRDI